MFFHHVCFFGLAPLYLFEKILDSKCTVNFEWPYSLSIFEPNCAHARWTQMHRFLSVHLSIHLWFTEQKSMVKGHKCEMSHCYKVECHIGHGQIRIPKRDRWADNNVKLLHWNFHFTIKQFVRKWHAARFERADVRLHKF